MSENILVTNHTRMGDLIQTTPVIRGLKEKNPDSRITMLANVSFAGILEFVEGVDEVVLLDIKQFEENGNEGFDILKVYEYLDNLAYDLQSRRFDKIINLSHSKLSAMLTTLIGADDIRGFLSSERGERVVRDPWLIYFTALLEFRKYNRFNLVDLYARGAGAALDGPMRPSLSVNTKSVGSVREKMAGLGIKDGDRIVGMQTGASRKDRRWSAASFAKVADRLIETRGVKVALFGSAVEKELGDEVTALMRNNAINLVGETSLNELIIWIKALDLLVTNDTGVMHIASAVDTPIVALFFTHARCEETGPYCDNAVILQADIDCAPCSHQTVCDHYSCLDYISPKGVAVSCETILDKKENLPNDPALFRRVKIYKSGFHRDGGIEYIPAKKRKLDKQEMFAYLYRPVFNEVMPRWDSPDKIGADTTTVKRAVADLMERFDSPSPADLNLWIDRAKNGAGKLISLARENSILAGEIVESQARAGDTRLGEISNRLEQINNDLSAISDIHEPLAPLVSVYRRRGESLEGDDAVELAKQARLASVWLEKSAQLFCDSIDTAAGKMKPWSLLK